MGVCVGGLGQTSGVQGLRCRRSRGVLAVDARGTGVWGRGVGRSLADGVKGVGG